MDKVFMRPSSARYREAPTVSMKRQNQTHLAVDGSAARGPPEHKRTKLVDGLQNGHNPAPSARAGNQITKQDHPTAPRPVSDGLSHSHPSPERSENETSVPAKNYFRFPEFARRETRSSTKPREYNLDEYVPVRPLFTAHRQLTFVIQR
jgi:hypothetical protein